MHLATGVHWLQYTVHRRIDEAYSPLRQYNAKQRKEAKREKYKKYKSVET